MQTKYSRPAAGTRVEYIVEITALYFWSGNVLWRQRKGKWWGRLGKHLALLNSELKLHFFFPFVRFLCGKPAERAWIPIDSMCWDIFPFTNAKVGMSTNP